MFSYQTLSISVETFGIVVVRETREWFRHTEIAEIFVFGFRNSSNHCCLCEMTEYWLIN